MTKRTMFILSLSLGILLGLYLSEYQYKFLLTFMRYIVPFTIVIAGALFAKYGPIKQWEDYTWHEQQRFRMMMEIDAHEHPDPDSSTYWGPILPEERWGSRVMLFGILTIFLNLDPYQFNQSHWFFALILFLFYLRNL